MTMCQWCEIAPATHLYKDEKVCEEHFNLFTEGDKLEASFASVLLPVMRAWVIEKASEGYEADALEGAIHGYAGGAESPFTLERIQQLIDEATRG